MKIVLLVLISFTCQLGFANGEANIVLDSDSLLLPESSSEFADCAFVPAGAAVQCADERISAALIREDAADLSGLEEAPSID